MQSGERKTHQQNALGLAGDKMRTAFAHWCSSFTQFVVFCGGVPPGCRLRWCLPVVGCRGRGGGGMGGRRMRHKPCNGSPFWPPVIRHVAQCGRQAIAPSFLLPPWPHGRQGIGTDYTNT